MISYLVNSMMCSAMLLLAYHLLLKNNAMFTFNRVYLLTSLVFSLTVPLVVVKQVSTPLPVIQPFEQLQFVPQNVLLTPAPAQLVHPIHQVINQPEGHYILYSLIAFYCIVTILLLCRLIINLNTIRLSVSHHEKVSWKTATLVLIDDKLTPHTFLNYIFLNKHDYNTQQIEPGVLRHELAHAVQRHSADVIFIELLQAICWFNPFLLMYRRAIQLNHEFIADAAVLNTTQGIQGYQNLLLSKLDSIRSLSITSQFNYSVTKKRLIMMNKTTSTATAWLIRIAFMPVMALAFVLFCNKTMSQGTAPAGKISTAKPAQNKNAAIQKRPSLAPEFAVPSRPYPFSRTGASDLLMREYASIAARYQVNGHWFSKVQIKNLKADQPRLEQIYKQMSREQQREQQICFMYPAPPLPKNLPTAAQLNRWEKSEAYGVWVDDKRIKNSELADRKPGDFNQFFVSNLSPYAQKNDGFRVQVNLMSVEYYKKYYKETLEKKNISMVYYRSFAPVNKKG